MWHQISQFSRLSINNWNWTGDADVLRRTCSKIPGIVDQLEQDCCPQGFQRIRGE